MTLELFIFKQMRKVNMVFSFNFDVSPFFSMDFFPPKICQRNTVTELSLFPNIMCFSSMGRFSISLWPPDC